MASPLESLPTYIIIHKLTQMTRDPQGQAIIQMFYLGKNFERRLKPSTGQKSVGNLPEII